MQMTLAPYSNGVSEITVSHKQQSITFKGTTYNRTILKEKESFFQDINAYWDSLPMSTQDAIWNIYLELDRAFVSEEGTNSVHKTLHQLLLQLYQYHSMDSFRYWIRFKSRVKYPPDLKEVYSPEYPKEMTYLLEDYRGLLAMTLGFRIVLPIVLRYTLAVEREQKGKYKEFMCLKLLEGTEIMNSPEMDQIRGYVTAAANVNEKPPSMSAILGGLGSTQIPMFFLAHAIIRRVIVSELKTEGDPVNIVSNVWNFVSQMDLDKRFGGATKDKNPTGAVAEDDKQSVAEIYKNKERISASAPVTETVFVGMYLNAKKYIDPTIDNGLAEMLWIHHKQSKSFDPETWQLVLMGWVLAPQVTFKTRDYLEPEDRNRGIAIAQALLWHWGFPQLAALLTASRAEPMHFEGASQNSAQLSLMKRAWRGPTEEMVREINGQYPHHRLIRGKFDPNQSNYAVVAINALFSMVVSGDWDLNCPRPLIDVCGMSEDLSGYAPPTDLKYQLYDFVIKNNRRKRGQQ